MRSRERRVLTGDLEMMVELGLRYASCLPITHLSLIKVACLSKYVGYRTAVGEQGAHTLWTDVIEP